MTGSRPSSSASRRSRRSSAAAPGTPADGAVRDCLTILHVYTYYSRVPEPIVVERRQTAAAADLLRIFHGMPRPVPPATVRDLTLGQLRLLLQLRNGPLSMGATGFVGRVERHGLVARQHRQDDRRIVECVLTPEGEHFL